MKAWEKTIAPRALNNLLFLSLTKPLAQVATLLSPKPKQNRTYITTIPQPTRNNTLTPKMHNITRRKITD
jgi:hypothetical protein